MLGEETELLLPAQEVDGHREARMVRERVRERGKRETDGRVEGSMLNGIYLLLWYIVC